MTLLVPSIEDSAFRHLDWLELSALLCGHSAVRLDELENSFEIEDDEEPADTSTRDSRLENFRTQVAGEVDHRGKSLGEAYPFFMSKNGEELKLANETNFGRVAYCISLIVEHSWSSGLLQRPCKMTPAEAQSVRQAFEILAAIGLAGFAPGPAFLIGSNRAGAAALLDRVREVCERAQHGRQRAAPLEDAPIHANDDGVDVIALELEIDGPPPRAFLFGQCASGEDWKGKSIKIEIDKFVHNWFEIAPVCARTPVMLVPRLPEKKEALQQTHRLGHLVHRLRLPKYVHAASVLATEQNDLIDCWDSRTIPPDWLDSYLARVRAHCEAA